MINMLQTDLRMILLRNPSALRQRVQATPAGSWTVIDEVQLVPDLLSEVHELMESGGYRFALSGSSARKIKRGQANLLAGRALLKHMYPLTYREVGDARALPRFIERGCLPMVVDGGEDWADILESYALTYLREEIQAEALTRNLGNFSRFLECAALANAQVTSLANLARDAVVARPTVQGYFQILQDTLVGYLLPAWRPRARVKEQAHPKFYWFDSGVVRAMANRLRISVEREEHGHLLETYVLHELRAYMHYDKPGGSLAYWRTPAGMEVDFVWSNGKTHLGIEVKSSRTWKRSFGAGLHALDDAVGPIRKFAVYLGQESLNDNGVMVLPLHLFLERLYDGQVLDPS